MAPLHVHGLSLAILVGFTLLELRSRQFWVDSFVDPVRRRRNWAFFVASLVPMQLVQAATFALEPHLPRLAAPGRLPWLWDLAGCFLVAELLSWLSHWVKHRHSWLWRFHFQHHREQHYSIWMVTHTHALEVAISGLVVSCVLTVCGVSLWAKQVYLLFYTASLLYHHSAHRYSLGPLDWLVVSPAYHRLHHEVGASGNYASTLTVFDMLFGTARWPDRRPPPERYGLEEGSPEPFGFVRELLYFLAPGVPRSPPPRQS